MGVQHDINGELLLLFFSDFKINAIFLFERIQGGKKEKPRENIFPKCCRRHGRGLLGWAEPVEEREELWEDRGWGPEGQT